MADWLHAARVPRWRAAYSAAALATETLFLQSEARRAVLRGTAVAAVGALVDGRRSVAAIHEALAGACDAYELARVLEGLEQAGYLETEVPAPQVRPRVQLEGIGVDVAPVAAALQLAGLRVVLDEDAALSVLLCEDWLDARVQQRLSARSGPVLLAKLGGSQPALGPWFDEAIEGPCPLCLAHALAWNRPAQRYVQERLGRPLPVPAPADAATLALRAGWLAQAIVNWSGGDRRLRSALLGLDPENLVTQWHVVRRRPQCAACGDPGWMAAQGQRAPRWSHSRVPQHHDGGYRCRSAEDTVAAYKPLVSAVTGVVQYLHPMPGRHAGPRKVYASGYPVCPQAWPHDNGFDKLCAGKGATDAQAQASALCEALERASGVWQGDEACVQATRAELGAAALSPQVLQEFSERQYARREVINAATRDWRRQVPLPFDDHARIAWTPAWPLSGEGRRWVPLAYCFAETPPGAGRAFGDHNPNGTAAGHVLEEAVLQGLLELVERDATAIWWYQRAARPAIDLDTVDDAFVRALRTDYAAGGWHVHVLDLTHDLRIPVFAAVAHHEGMDRHALGFGCHLDGRIALLRALTELNQLLDPRPDAPSPWNRKLLPHAGFLRPQGPLAPWRHANERGNGVATLGEALATCVARLAQAGLEALVVDKTRPDIGLCVAQVIVPGLRHFWPRFGPGRLYDVPRKLGWRDAVDDEEALNPAPLFL